MTEQLRCPTCKQPIKPGATRCLACGENLRPFMAALKEQAAAQGEPSSATSTSAAPRSEAGTPAERASRAGQAAASHQPAPERKREEPARPAAQSRSAALSSASAAPDTGAKSAVAASQATGELSRRTRRQSRHHQHRVRDLTQAVAALVPKRPAKKESPASSSAAPQKSAAKPRAATASAQPLASQQAAPTSTATKASPHPAPVKAAAKKRLWEKSPVKSGATDKQGTAKMPVKPGTTEQRKKAAPKAPVTPAKPAPKPKSKPASAKQEEASSKPAPHRWLPRRLRKPLLALGLVVLAFLLWGSWYYSSSSQLNRLVTRLDKQEDVSASLKLSSSTKAVSKTEAAAFEKAVTSKQSTLTKLQAAFKRGKSYEGLRWVKDGHHWLIFPAYKVEAAAAAVTLSSNRAKVALYQGDEKLTTTSAKNKQALRFLYPGTYTFKASGTVKGKQRTVKKTVRLTAGAITQVKLNLAKQKKTSTTSLKAATAKTLLNTAFTGLTAGANSTVASEFVNGASNSSYNELIEFYEPLESKLLSVKVVKVKQITKSSTGSFQVTYAVRYTFQNSDNKRVQQFTYQGGEIVKSGSTYKIKSIGKTGTSPDWQKTYDED